MVLAEELDWLGTNFHRHSHRLARWQVDVDVLFSDREVVKQSAPVGDLQRYRP
jgi:hypothetical protein